MCATTDLIFSSSSRPWLFPLDCLAAEVFIITKYTHRVSESCGVFFSSPRRFRLVKFILDQYIHIYREGIPLEYGVCLAGWRPGAPLQIYAFLHIQFCDCARFHVSSSYQFSMHVLVKTSKWGLQKCGFCLGQVAKRSAFLTNNSFLNNMLLG